MGFAKAVGVLLLFPLLGDVWTGYIVDRCAGTWQIGGRWRGPQKLPDSYVFFLGVFSRFLLIFQCFRIKVPGKKCENFYPVFTCIYLGETGWAENDDGGLRIEVLADGHPAAVWKRHGRGHGV
jgi:hypothetical protein